MIRAACAGKGDAVVHSLQLMASISVRLQVVAVQWLFLLLQINALILTSSVEPMKGQVTVCPDTILTFTCSDTQVIGIRWFALPLLNEDNTPGFAIASDTGVPIVVEDVLTITLVAAERTMGFLGNFTTTLTVVVSEIMQNGTNVTCMTPNVVSLLLFKQGPPLAPSNVTVQTMDYQAENFTILLSWDGQEDNNYTVNISGYSVHTTTVPSLILKAEYNIPLLIILRAVNCAGKSEQVKVNVSVAGCSPPTPPVNGSVSKFTSSRVGAQVTYSCDTDLVLEGERVATCSEPSLQWLPSSEDIMCVQPPVCSDPSEQLTSHASISSLNRSMVTYSCDPGYSLHGSATSQCVSGEWTPSPETVTCNTAHDVNTPLPSPVGSCDNNTTNSKTSVSLSTSVVVAITAVVCGVCSFTAGLVLGVLLTRYSVCCHRNKKRVQTAGPVHEVDDILPEKGAGIELQKNEAYEYVSH